MINAVKVFTLRKIFIVELGKLIFEIANGEFSVFFACSLATSWLRWLPHLPWIYSDRYNGNFTESIAIERQSTVPVHNNDYCSGTKAMDETWNWNFSRHLVSFRIPTLYRNSFKHWQSVWILKQNKCTSSSSNNLTVRCDHSSIQQKPNHKLTLHPPNVSANFDKLHGNN